MDIKPTNPIHDLEESLRRRAHSRFFSRIGLAILVFTVVTFVAQYAAAIAVAALRPDMMQTWWFNFVLSMVPMYGVALPVMLLVLRGMPKGQVSSVWPRRLPDGVVEDHPKPPLRVGTFVVIVLMALGYMQIGSMIGNGLMGVMSRVMGYDYVNGLESLVEEAPLWASFLFMVILAPLGEELVFRKVLMDRTRRFGDTPAVLISALFFALFHGNLFQFFYAFLLGLLLGYLYARTGKLRWSVALHAIVNFMGGPLVLLLRGLVDMEKLSSGDAELMMQAIAEAPLGYALVELYSLAMIGLAVASIVLTVARRRRTVLGRGEVTLQREEAVAVTMGNVGMVAAFALTVLLMALNLIPATA